MPKNKKMKKENEINKEFYLKWQNKILAKLEKLEQRVFGKTESDKTNKIIKLSKLGIKTFPEMKKDVFYLLRWSRDDGNMLKVRRKGNSSTQTYHKDYFVI